MNDVIESVAVDFSETIEIIDDSKLEIGVPRGLIYRLRKLEEHMKTIEVHHDPILQRLVEHTLTAWREEGM
jgi:hypothetical protein